MGIQASCLLPDHGPTTWNVLCWEKWLPGFLSLGYYMFLMFINSTEQHLVACRINSRFAGILLYVSNNFVQRRLQIPWLHSKLSKLLWNKATLRVSLWNLRFRSLDRTEWFNLSLLMSRPSIERKWGRGMGSFEESFRHLSMLMLVLSLEPWFLFT